MCSSSRGMLSAVQISFLKLLMKSIGLLAMIFLTLIELIVDFVTASSKHLLRTFVTRGTFKNRWLNEMQETDETTKHY